MRGANGALRPSPLCTNLVRLPFTALGRPLGVLGLHCSALERYPLDSRLCQHLPQKHHI